MSGNPLNSFSASDSGILAGFGGLLPGHARIDSAKQSLHGDPPSSHSVETDGGDTERRLRDVPLPEGFLSRMREAATRFAS